MTMCDLCCEYVTRTRQHNGWYLCTECRKAEIQAQRERE